MGRTAASLAARRRDGSIWRSEAVDKEGAAVYVVCGLAFGPALLRCLPFFPMLVGCAATIGGAGPGPGP